MGYPAKHYNLKDSRGKEVFRLIVPSKLLLLSIAFAEHVDTGLGHRDTTKRVLGWKLRYKGIRRNQGDSHQCKSERDNFHHRGYCFGTRSLKVGCEATGKGNDVSGCCALLCRVPLDDSTERSLMDR
jgi:hypothetical protein